MRARVRMTYLGYFCLRACPIVSIHWIAAKTCSRKLISKTLHKIRISPVLKAIEPHPEPHYSLTQHLVRITLQDFA
jgi:hypothetical protein